MEDYFALNKSILEKFINFTKKYDNQENSEVIKLCGNFLQEILNSGDTAVYNTSCQFNISRSGQKFIKTLQQDSYGQDTFDFIIFFILRIAKEAEIRLETYDIHPSGEILIKKYKNKNNVYRDENFAKQIDYIFDTMPFVIINYYFLNRIKTFQDSFIQTVENIFSEKLAHKENEIKDLQNYANDAIQNLDNFRKGANFVLLNNAFEDLRNKKSKERVYAFMAMFYLAAMTILIPIFIYFFNDSSFTSLLIKGKAEYAGVSMDFSSLAEHFFKILPIVFIETMLIYYFRIALHKYNSIIEQIIQIETKQSLVQFIESYVKYKKDNNIAKEDLEKFEEIIFSKITSNSNELPNAPDIVSMVERLSKAVRK